MQLAIQLIISGALALGTADTSLQIRDIDGGLLRPFRMERTAGILFFLSTECPISRSYAREIQRICNSYAAHATCRLIYEDVPLAPAAVRQHLREFGYSGIPAAIDTTGKVALEALARVTPTAVVIDRSGRVRYHGRIDDFYAGLGTSRARATVHDLRDALDAIVSGRPVAQPETKPVGCFINSPEVLKNLQSEGGR